MNKIRPLDMILLDELFVKQGYVLDFSDRTFTYFFAVELNVDIDAPQYRKDGTSKGNRLRCFLKAVDSPTVIRTLKALWDYRKAINERVGTPENIVNAEGRFLALIERLEGRAATTGSSGTAPVQAFDTTKVDGMKAKIMNLWEMDPHPRGVAFETFLKEFFDLYGLAAREQFRLVGEQIDGSFLLSDEVYLLEAKWHADKIGAADLRNFHGKLDEKMAWTRGLFVSYSGFTDEGLIAFGRGKKLICMDGYDLYETLNRQLPLAEVLSRKVRRAGETGHPFCRVVDLFS